MRADRLRKRRVWRLEGQSLKGMWIKPVKGLVGVMPLLGKASSA